MKKLFLSSSAGYEWDHVKSWNLSAKKTGHDVCNIFINPTKTLIDSCVSNGVDSVSYFIQNTNKPPHNLRFLLQYKYLMSIVDRYSHVVLTDSRDVYFHSDPFPSIERLMQKHGKSIVCGSECIAYQDESWGNGNLMEGFSYVYEEYKAREICNVGVLCGDVKSIAELCLMLFTMCYHNPASVSDQSSFNILMGTAFGNERIATTRPSDGLMVHLGTVGVQKFRDKLTEKPTWDENGLPMIDDVVIPIIHQYDRIDRIKALIY